MSRHKTTPSIARTTLQPLTMTKLHTQIEIQRLKDRSDMLEFSSAIGRLRRETDNFLCTPMSIPDRSAGFYHNYFCPEHAVELVFDPNLPTQHRCPRDDHFFTGEPFDSAWLWFINNKLSTMAFSLAIRWCIDKQDRLLYRIVEILTGYATQYRRYIPDEIRSFGNGKATFQSLDEAVWLIPLVQAYDLVQDALSDLTRYEIEHNLLQPAATHIRSQKYNQIHNIENWHNAAIAAVGICTDEEDLITHAIDDTNGFHDQLTHGVLNDGLWWEGSSSYHYYALAPLITLAHMCDGQGMNLWKNERLEKMFRTPVDLVFPDFRLPAGNDCWFFSSLTSDVCHGVPAAVGFYERAHSWYDDPAFGWVLSENYKQSPRDSLESLLYGRNVITPVDPPQLKSINCKPSGFAMLRSQESLENQDCLLLKYGPHGGGHGHPDKLSTSIYASGEDISVDLGTPGYGIELHETWYRQTLSHNTVMVDGLSQPPAHGELIHFGTSSNADFEIVDAKVDFDNSTYEGVSLRRIILWCQGYFIDFVQVKCDRDRQIDLIHRTKAKKIASDGLKLRNNPTAIAEERGYQHISDAMSYQAGANVQLRWKSLQRSTAIHLPIESESEIILGFVPHNPSSEKNMLMIRRRRAQETAFLSVFELSPSRPLSVCSWAEDVKNFWGILTTLGSETRAWMLGYPGCDQPDPPKGASIKRYQL